MTDNVEFVQWTWNELGLVFRAARESGEFGRLEYVKVPDCEDSFVGNAIYHRDQIAPFILSIAAGKYEDCPDNVSARSCRDAIMFLNQMTTFDVNIIDAWYRQEESKNFPLTRQYLIMLDYVRTVALSYLYKRYIICFIENSSK
jgi:hypothetical protein